MKRNRLFLIIATAVALGCMTTSCSQDTDIAVAPNDGDFKTPISFNVGIGSLPAPEVTTRGYTTSYGNASGYTFVAGDTPDRICVAITGTEAPRLTSPSSEEKKIYSIQNATTGKLEYVSGGTENREYDWYSKNENFSVRAWGLGNNTTTDTDPSGQMFYVSKTQNTDASIQELLYMKSTSKNYNDETDKGTVKLSLYHQMARIVVNIKRDDTSSADVSAVTIGDNSDGNRIPIAGTFTLPSSPNYGSWATTAYESLSTDDRAAQYGTIAAKAESSHPDGYEYSYSAVVIPAGTDRYTADMKLINITVGTETFVYKIPSGGITFSSGCQYNFNITIKNKAIDVTGCTITDWGSGSNGGTVTINTLP